MPAIGELISDEALLFLEEDNEDLGVDTVFVSDSIDNMSGRFAVKSVVGHTDVAVIANVPSVSLGAIDFGIIASARRIFIAGVLGLQEILNISLGHGIIITHDGVGHDIPGLKTGGVGVFHILSNEESESGGHKEGEDGEK